MNLALILSVGGLAAVVVCWVRYLATVPSGLVPERPTFEVALAAVGVALAIAGLALGLREPRTLVFVTAGVAVAFGALFLFLLTQRRTPAGTIAVVVGDRLPAFESATSDGAVFESASLRGRRILLKFFRGSW